MTARWRRVRSVPRGDFRIFRVREDYYVHPGKDGERSFFVIESADWVNVIAVTPEDEIVFIRQFRPGVGGVRLEIPGGIVEEGEEPARAAARELLEETGFAGDEPVHLCTTEPNPAIQDNRCHSFLVTGARRVAEPAWDDDEWIDCELRPAADLARLVERGEMVHALLLVPLLRYMRMREGAEPFPGPEGG